MPNKPAPPSKSPIPLKSAVNIFLIPLLKVLRYLPTDYSYVLVETVATLSVILLS